MRTIQDLVDEVFHLGKDSDIRLTMFASQFLSFFQIDSLDCNVFSRRALFIYDLVSTSDLLKENVQNSFMLPFLRYFCYGDVPLFRMMEPIDEMNTIEKTHQPLKGMFFIVFNGAVHVTFCMFAYL